MLDENGEPWFVVAKDVCDVLEHSNHKVALQGFDGDEVRKVYLTDSLGRKQKTNVVDESGFYTLVMRSNKLKAKPFRKWVTREVLPSIRKTGQYSLPKQTLKNKVEQVDFAKFVGFIPDPANREKSRDIYPVYQSWCLLNKCPARTIQWVGMQLKKLGYKRGKCPPKNLALWLSIEQSSLSN